MEQAGVVRMVREMGVARSRALTDAGYSRALLSRMVERGELQRTGRGLYSAVDHELTEWHDLAELARAVPLGVVALISALAFHEIGTQVPYQTWLALPQGAWAPKRQLRVVHLGEPYYSAGVEEHVIEGVPVRIYSAAKTVTDCFRMRSKVGYDVAVEALRDGWRKGKFTLDELAIFAKLNRVDKVMRPYIEVITS